MKHRISLLCVILLLVSCNTPSTTANSYAKNDLKKIRWIEGNWKGTDGQNPFYEIYKFINDTTIEITSYDWNGTDSSHSATSVLAWKNNHYYLGDSLNYKVVEITDSTISMDPNYKANNSILWKTKNATEWMALLKSKNGDKTYTMERINHFAK